MRFFIAALTLISSTAFANCPNLAGTYATCRSTTGNSTGSTNLTVKQYIKDNVTIYETEATDNHSHEVETAMFITDGRVIRHSDSSEGTTVDFAQASQCANNTLYTAVSVSTQGQVLVTVEGAFFKSGNTLFQKIKTTTTQGVFEDTLICE